MSYKRTLAITWLALLYSAMFYLQFSHRILLDFSSFYQAALAITQHMNPYQVLTTTFPPIGKKLPTNLNPPSVLWLLQPLVCISYTKGLMLWSAMSTFCGIQAANITYAALKKHAPGFTLAKIDFWIIYFSLFCVFMNTAIGQVGAFIFFFALKGYDAIEHKKQIQAGLYWGIIAAFKFFPLLLLVYALLRRQWATATILVLSFTALTLAPLIFYGQNLYINYFIIIKKVFWYGDSWNASLFGYLFRLFIDANDRMQPVAWLRHITLGLSMVVGLGYLRTSQNLIKQQHDFTAFCLTLVTMLLLSPLGWLYYFQLLLPAGLLIWHHINRTTDATSKSLIIGFMALALLNTPIVYITSLHMTTLIPVLTFYSCHFYGLVLAFIFLSQSDSLIPAKAVQLDDTGLMNTTLLIIIILGVLLPSYYIAVEFFKDLRF